MNINYEGKVGLISLSIVGMTWLLNLFVMALKFEYNVISRGSIDIFEAISIFLTATCLIVVINLIIGRYKK